MMWVMDFIHHMEGYKSSSTEANNSRSLLAGE